ncbi:hypothetical protein [Sorangium sp. So ce131]|uniref:hypothetical protein n=1 Tax=Sorangium sp. So ce131 TaxID=3133282 RepID=UPI003F618854
MARPAERVDAESKTVPVKLSSDFRAQLAQARGEAGSREQLKRLAEERRRANALASAGDLHHGAGLVRLLGSLAARRDAPRNVLEELVRTALGADARSIVAAATFTQDRERLSDAVAADFLLGDEGGLRTADAAALLRVASIVERVGKNDSTIEATSAIANALSRTLLLPGDVFPVPGLRNAASSPGQGGAHGPGDQGGDAGEQRALRDRLRRAYDALTRVTPDHVHQDPDEEAADEGEVPTEPAPQPADPAARNPGIPAAARGLRARPFVLSAEAAAAFDADALGVLAERGLDLTRLSLPTVVERLSTELQGLELSLAEREGAAPVRLISVGSTLVPDVVGAVGSIEEASVPTTHGTIAPAGVGDLLVVRQFLKRYEARELAHVENILRGEFKEKTHRRARTTEETVTVEIESKREEERDQQTTERFELKNESSQVVKDDQSLKIGAAVSGKYGPVVEFKVSTDFAMNRAKEESAKVATSYSKDVTGRATSRLSERRREERILKTIEVFEETNKHGVDNKNSGGHVIGQYQWLDKVYEAQVFNYGKRLLFDIVLPEPAAFFLHAASDQPKPGPDLVRPAPFTLKPSDVNEGNYAFYVQRYGVIGVEPPPGPYLTLARVMEGQADEGHSITKAIEVPITDGYQAISGNVLNTFTLWEDNAAVDVFVGQRGHRFTKNGGWSWSFSMNNEVGSVPMVLKSWKAGAVVTAVEILCQRTPRALDAWKLKTHAAILQAYQKQLRDYEEKLAALEVEAASKIEGRNPSENEHLIRAELKKGALSVFTWQHYDLFGAVSTSAQGYPQPSLAEAEKEGAYIRFFEQAFEWEQMMFFFYPYFWGRKSNWTKRALLQDTDPLFAEFIKAGAARLVVSVRPGFEAAVAHFLETGEIWNGSDLPEVTSPLYVNIIEEIKERDKAPGTEVAQGDPWDVRLPTTLIKLREQSSLPEWQKDGSGRWVPQ